MAWPFPDAKTDGKLTAEYRPGGNSTTLSDFTAAQFLAVLEFGLQNLDRAALYSHFETLRGYSGNFANFAGNIGETSEKGLACVKNL